MPTITVNYLAILVSAIASMVLGFLWYGPLFGKKWMALSGINPEAITLEMKAKMRSGYILTFIGSLVMAYVLAHFIGYVAAMTLAAGATLAFWVWLGFVAPLLLGSVLWEGKPWGLYFLNAAHQLVNLIIVAGILAVWH